MSRVMPEASLVLRNIHYCSLELLSPFLFDCLILVHVYRTLDTGVLLIKLMTLFQSIHVFHKKVNCYPSSRAVRVRLSSLQLTHLLLMY